ncbi:MAG: hypothetical protein WBE76_00280 [Terracidiphilus sp.]
MTFPRLHIFAAAAVCASSWIVFAQESAITTETKATPDEIRQWLESGDPRLIAWGAYFAGQDKVNSALAPMLELVDDWQTPVNAGDAAAHERQDAMAAVLDALILRNISVPPESLLAVGDSFPAQSAILASRLPIGEATPLLQNWYRERNEGKQPRLARLAAMMLAKSPPPGFAASVLAETEDHVQVTVVDPGTGFGSGGGICYGLGGGIPHRPGWPFIYRYALEENSQQIGHPLLIEAGGDRITYDRTLEGGEAFFQVRSLDDETRQHLLLEMLGGNRTALQWATQQQISLEWEGPANFLTDLRNIVNEEESKLRDTVEEFTDMGLLSPDEAARIRPRLSVLVFDSRESKEAPLPDFEYSDLHTSVWLEPALGQEKTE